MDGPGSNVAAAAAAAASKDFEVSQHLDSSVEHKVGESKPFKNCGLITAFNPSKIVDINETSPVIMSLDKIAVQPGE